MSRPWFSVIASTISGDGSDGDGGGGIGGVGGGEDGGGHAGDGVCVVAHVGPGVDGWWVG